MVVSASKPCSLSRGHESLVSLAFVSMWRHGASRKSKMDLGALRFNCLLSPLVKRKRIAALMFALNGHRLAVPGTRRAGVDVRVEKHREQLEAVHEPWPRAGEQRPRVAPLADS